MNPLSTMPRLGFAGLGLMGMPMCQRLLDAGYQLNIWDRSDEPCHALSLAGAHRCESLAAADQRPLPLVALARSILKAHAQAGHVEHDLSSLILQQPGQALS